MRNFVSKWKYGEIPTVSRDNLADKFSNQEKATIDAQIAGFLSKGIVSYSESQVGQIISPIFLRPKSGRTYRHIFNLKALNDNVVYHHFKLDITGLKRRVIYRFSQV